MSTRKALLFSGAALIVFGLLSLIALGVTGYFIDSPDDLTQQSLNRNRNWWDNYHQENYNYVYTSVCFGACPLLPVEVVVRDGKVVGSGGLTIEGLFDRIQYAMNEDFHILNVKYSSRYGAPTRIFMDQDRNAVDDEWTFWMNEIHPLDSIPVPTSMEFME